MSDHELKMHLQALVKELERRRKPKDELDKILQQQQQQLTPTPAPNICNDLFAVSTAIQRALIDNGCLPL